MIQIAFGFSVGRSSKQKGKKTSTVQRPHVVVSVCVTAHLQSCNSLCVCACVCWRASSWKHIHSRQEEKRSTTAFICSLLPMCHRSSMSRIELRVRAPATKKKVNYVSCVSTPIRSRHTPFWTKKGNQKDDKKR